MPRVGLRRKKVQTHVTEELSEEAKRNIPRSFVVKKGKIGNSLRDLMVDFRKVMSPNCAVKLKEKKNAKLRDYVNVAHHFHVSHINQFTQTDHACYFKVGRLPQGPTMTFKLMDFSLVSDVKSQQKRPRNSHTDGLVAPSLILNGFSKAVKAGVPGVELCAQVLRGMFPPVDINTFNVKQCRRVVLFHLEDETDSTEDASSSAASKKQESNSKSSKTSSNQLIYFRQYAVEVADAGLSKNVKRMVGKDQINSRLMQKLEAGKEAADLVLDEGADSESEAEEDAVITTKNKQKRGGLRQAATTQQKQIKLVEIGPRMTFQLVKGEDGLYEGAVLFHKFIQKSTEEQTLLAKRALEKNLKAERKQEEKEEAEEKKADLKERREANLERQRRKQLGDLLDSDDEDEDMDEEDEEMDQENMQHERSSSSKEVNEDSDKDEKDSDMEVDSDDEEPALDDLDAKLEAVLKSQKEKSNKIQTKQSIDLDKSGALGGGGPSREGTVEFGDSNTQKKKERERLQKLARAQKKGGKGGKGKGKGKGGSKKSGSKMSVMDKFMKTGKK